jgi:hypothetical protein
LAANLKALRLALANSVITVSMNSGRRRASDLRAWLFEILWVR